MKYSHVLYAVCIICMIGTLGCSKNNEKNDADGINIAVFVPGIVSGGAVYEMLVAGVSRAADEHNNADQPVLVDIIEAGTDQSQWANLLTALTAAEKYEVIISSNPSLPEIVETLTRQFPKQKFILLDAFIEGNQSIAAAQYNQREEAYLVGYMAGLVTVSDMPYANEAKKIGLIAAQEYPVMNNILLPSFIEGAQAVDPSITVDFRIVGNWFDATKSAELARSMFQSGVDVILPISGGANQGVISSAKELGFYITWFDNNGFNKAPNYIVASAVIDQEAMAYRMIQDFIEGKTAWGETLVVGVTDGFVDFISDDPLYLDVVPKDIQEKMSAVFLDIKEEVLLLPSPQL